MSFKIVVDSCCEVPDEYRGDPRFEFVPLTIEIGEFEIVDDKTFDQKRFLKLVAESPTGPKSSCPSPERYIEAYSADVDDVYVITLSSKLSGSHNSAVLGRQMYLEKYGEKNIHVCDSEAAVSGEGVVALMALELAEQGIPFAEVVEKLEAYRDVKNTYFVLDNLETLRKAGRLKGVKALVATTLSIKPVMSALKGDIIQKSQAIGIKKALAKMVDIVIAERPDKDVPRLMIAHCNNLERALVVKKMLEEKANYKEITIVVTKGISTMYSNDGGVVIGV